jgi:hypothetical protein
MADEVQKGLVFELVNRRNGDLREIMSYKIVEGEAEVQEETIIHEDLPNSNLYYYIKERIRITPKSNKVIIRLWHYNSYNEDDNPIYEETFEYTFDGKEWEERLIEYKTYP